MDEPAENPDVIKHETVKRPMNAFLIFCKRHRGLVHEKNPSLDNRSVTRILGDLWANLGPDEKYMYTDLAKQYKEAFLKANPDYKWYNPEKHTAQVMTSGSKPGRPTGSLAVPHSSILSSTGISPGKLADPSNMGGLSMLLMAGQQTLTTAQMSTSNPPPPSVTRALTVADQRAVELASGRNVTSNHPFHSWPSVAPPARKMDTDNTQTKMSAYAAGRTFGGSTAEETKSFPSHKNSGEWPMDLSRVTDSFQTPCIESRQVLAEIDRSSGVPARRDPIAVDRSPDRGEPISKVISEPITKELVNMAWSTTDAVQGARPDITGQSSWPLSRSDAPRFFGPATTPPSESKIPFIGHPLTYLFNQPTQQMSTNQRLKILLPNSPPAVSTAGYLSTKNADIPEPGSNSERPTSSGVGDDSKFGGLASFSRSNVGKFVVEKVIEAAFSRELEHEAGIQSFPKTKKQLAIDKLSKPNTPTHNRNGSQEPSYGFNVNPVSRSMSLPSSVEGSTTLETPEKLHFELRRSTMELSEPERNGDVAGMTIGEINEKLIMKVVQEEDATTLASSVQDLPIGEGRMPLKLQKRFKRLDGVARSASFGSSSPDRSCSSSVLDLDASSGLSAPALEGQLQAPFSCVAEKPGFPTAVAQKVLTKSNLLAAYPEFLRSGSLFSGERRQLGLMMAGSTSGTFPSPKSSIPSHSGVDKLIETLIHESFAQTELLNTDTKQGYSISQPQTTGSTTPCEDSRTRPDHETLPASSSLLRHVNKALDGAKTPKRKRSRRTESSSDQSLDPPRSSEKSVVKEDAFRLTEETPVKIDPADGTDDNSSKRPRDRTGSTSADETCPDVSSAASDPYKTSGCSDGVRIAGAWHLIDNILNERVIDLNGGRAREEINNNNHNGREKATVDHDGLASSSSSTNKALRKSKRANQGLRYKELMSKGVLYASRKSTDSNILIEDNRDNVDATNDDEGNDVCGAAEMILPRRRFHADSTSLDMDTEAGRRYKSGDFDLEAHIASLPACQIEVTDRKTAGKIKSRSHSQSAASTCISFLRFPHHKRTDLKADELKNRNGLSLEEISFSKLHRLSRLSMSYRKNRLCLFGSARRKARTYCIVQLLPVSVYHAAIAQPSTHEATTDEPAISSPMACTTLTVISSSSSDDASSFGHQMAAEQEAFEAQKREIQTSFDILAAAAAVSSSGE